MITIGTATTTAAVTVYGQREPILSGAGALALVASNSGSLVKLLTVPAVTLPAPVAGVVYRFVVTADITANATITATGALLQGSMIVAGATVDVDGTTVFTIDATKENVGDYLELRSDGTNWFVTQSNFLTTAAITSA